MKKQIITALLLISGMQAFAATNYIEKLPDESLIKQLYTEQKKSTTNVDLLNSIERINRGIHMLVDYKREYDTKYNESNKQNTIAPEELKKQQRKVVFAIEQHIFEPLKYIITHNIKKDDQEGEKLATQEQVFLIELIGSVLQKQPIVEG